MDDDASKPAAPGLTGPQVRGHGDLARFDPALCVLKLGSAVVTTNVGELDSAVLGEVAGFAARRLDRGRATLIVSSGAVAAGIGMMGLAKRPKHLPDLQALAAIGQSRLMDAWGQAFAAHGRSVAQVLVSAEDFRDRRRYLNMRYTFERLFQFGVVPIVNENDTITIDELRFGDNDGLAQLIAIKMVADLLVFMTGIGGLFRLHGSADGVEIAKSAKGAEGPEGAERAKRTSDAEDAKDANRPAGQPELVLVVEKITPDVLALASGEKSNVGSGGMRSKLEAARQATLAGIPVLIAPGKQPGALDRLLRGEGGGTLLLAEGAPARYSRRERFIAFSRLAPRGRLWVDDGAARALVTGKKSLLPAGVTRTEGEYERGFVVEVLDPADRVIARGLTSYGSREVQIIKGKKTAEIESLLGSRDYDEIIHRDNLVVLDHPGS
jgi:glutamate 5-kinase